MTDESAPKVTRSQQISTFLKRFHIDGQTFLLISVFITLVLFFSFTVQKFFTSRSITSMAFQLPELGILSLAMMITILCGGINLSVNATSNLAAVVAGLFLTRMLPANVDPYLMGWYILFAFLIAILIGFLCGVLNGIMVGYIGVPPILATLATYTFFTGISTGLTKGVTVTGFPEAVSIIGSKTIAGVPIPFIIFVALAILTYIILNGTPFGFKTRMIGTNPTAAEFSAVENRKVLLGVYILSGILSAVAGILVMSRTMSAAYEYGTTTYVLLTILISVLAGVIPGFGKVIDIFIAVLILQVLSTGFHMLLTGVRGSSFFRDFAWGILLIIIFIVNYFVRGRTKNE